MPLPIATVPSTRSTVAGDDLASDTRPRRARKKGGNRVSLSSGGSEVHTRLHENEELIFGREALTFDGPLCR